jgi:hypothetical protein
VNDVDAIDNDNEASLVVKVKQERFVPSRRCGGFHLLCLFFVLLYSVQFKFVSWFWLSSDVVESMDKGFTESFTESTFMTAPIFPA